MSKPRTAKPQDAFLTFAPVIERDAEGLPKRFTGEAYSGGVIPSFGWYGDAAIDMATFEAPAGAIFALVDHAHEKRAGKLTAKVSGNAVHIAGEFFTSTDAGREVAALFQEGAPWQLSVGINAKAKTSSENSPVKVNGKTLQIQTLFTNARLREVSFVPVGADPNTAAVAFARQSGDAPAITGDEEMSEELNARVAELEGQLAAANARADVAEATVEAQLTAARNIALAALATDIGRALTEAETTTLRELPEPAFINMAGMLRTFKAAPAADPANVHLFREQATGGDAPKPEAERLQLARRKIVNQVAGKAA